MPVPTLDASLNPMSIRVTYEVNQGGQRFWTGGASGLFSPVKNLQLGAGYVQDANPQDPNKIFSGSALVKLPGKTSFRGEFAGTDHLLEGLGLGYRFELQTDGDRLKAKAYFGRTETNFDNPTSVLNKGRGESGIKSSLQLAPGLRLLAEVVRTEDISTASRHQGAALAFQNRLPENGPADRRVGQSDETSTPASQSKNVAAPSTGNP